MTEEQLAQLNIIRAASGRAPLQTSPGLRFLKAGNGKGREGWWNSEKFMEQATDIVEAFEVLYPDKQLVFEVDWSCGHNAFAADALRTENMGVNFAGAQAKLQSTVITAQDLGKHNPKLAVGDTQHMQFREGDSAPFYQPAAPAHDILDGDGKILQQGFVGKPKGMKQVLHERGLWTETCQCGCGRKMIGTAKKETDKCRAMDALLKQCYDFATQRSQFDILLRDRGHVPLFSPKYHPELAGSGIEYSWGKSKYAYRRANVKTLGFYGTVRHVLGPEVLPLLRVRKFGRRGRQYMRVYHSMATDQPEGATCKDDIEDRVMVRRPAWLPHVHCGYAILKRLHASNQAFTCFFNAVSEALFQSTQKRSRF